MNCAFIKPVVGLTLLAKASHLACILVLMLSVPFFCNTVHAQELDCSTISLEYIGDTLDSEGVLAATVRLSTTENEFNTGYTNMWIIDNEGDTVAGHDLWSLWLPAIETVGDSVITYNIPFYTIYLRMTRNSDLKMFK